MGDFLCAGCAFHLLLSFRTCAAVVQVVRQLTRELALQQLAIDCNHCGYRVVGQLTRELALQLDCTLCECRTRRLL